MFSYLLAELIRRPTRTAVAMISVGLGVALFLSLQAYSTGYREAARAPLAEIGADIAAQRQGAVPEEFAGPVFPHSVAPIHREEIEAIKQLPGVEGVEETVFFWDFGPDYFTVVLGIDGGATSSLERLRNAVVDGRFFTAGETGVAVADAAYARENGVVINDSVPIAGQAFTIIGLIDTSQAGQVANANIYMPLTDARTLVYNAPNVQSVHDFQPDDANILFIKANQAQAEALTTDLETLLGEQALVSSAQSFNQVLGESFRLVDRFGWLVSLAGLLIAIAALLRAVAANLWERRRDIGLMRAVGWRKAEIVRQLVSEALALAIGGGIIGVLIALIVTFSLGQTSVTIPVPWELSPTPHFLPGGALEMAVTIPLPARIEPVAGITAFGLAILCGIVVGFTLANQAANRKPAEVLRVE